MKEFLSIGEAAVKCGVHVDTLRNWELSGKLIPDYTPGGHRRYAANALRDFMKTDNKKIMVFHKDKEKTTIIETDVIPQKGDIVWLNTSCYEVEKVVHFWMQGHSDTEPCGNNYVRVFIKDASREDSLRYYTFDTKYHFDCVDNLSEFSLIDVEMFGHKQTVELRFWPEHNEYNLTLCFNKNIADMFTKNSKHTFKINSYDVDAVVAYQSAKNDNQIDVTFNFSDLKNYS